MLAEYLYVDAARLDSYFEQISSPIAFDKNPTWKVGISLTGPVGERTQSSVPRPYTQHEKICAVLDYLHQNSQLRDPEQDTFAAFVFESLDATRVHIPVPKDAGLNRDFLNLWVGAPKTAGSGFRFLLENFSGKEDGRPAVLSGFSCLQAMLDEYGQIVRDFLIQNIERAQEGNSPKKLTNESWDRFKRVVPWSQELRGLISSELERAGFSHTSLPVVIDSWGDVDKKIFSIALDKKRYSLRMTPHDVIIERQEDKELSLALISEPLTALEHWGAKIGDQRPVDALYRIRQAGRDYALLPHLRHITVVGYPIFLASHPSPFTEDYISVE